jgi:hypothetical protein
MTINHQNRSLLEDDAWDKDFPLPERLRKRQAKAIEKALRERKCRLMASKLRNEAGATQKGISRRLKLPISKIRRWTRNGLRDERP